MTRTRTTRPARGHSGRQHPTCGHVGSRRRVDSRRGGAFSLMEVLIALGIFALGLVAVAAVFPTAIAIQSETVRDLAGQRAVINARATIQAMARSTEPSSSNKFLALTFKKVIAPPPGTSVTYSGTLASYGDSAIPATGRTGFPGGVQPMIDQPLPPTSPVNAQLTLPPFAEMSAASPLNAPKSFHNLFSEDTRSYPKNIAATDKRDYYWFPLIKASDLTGDTSIWKVYLMVMQRRGTEAVPEVRAVRVTNANNNVITFANSYPPNPNEELVNDTNNNGLPDLLQPGDWVLGDDGSIFRVVIATNNTITIDSTVPITKLNLLYYAVARDGLDGTIKRESRSAIVRIEQFEIVVNEPAP